MSKLQMIGLAALSFATGACVTAAVQSTTVVPNAVAAQAPTVTPLEKASKAQAPNGKATIYRLARGTNAFIGKLEMGPGGGVPEHRDPTEEYIHVLSGGGKMFIDDVAYDVTAGTTIYMPANAKVRFENSDAPLVAIQVFAGPEPAAKYNSWKPLP